MSKQREALQVALDTLRGWIGIDEWIWPVTAKETCKKNSLEAIAAIREALAEPEQKSACFKCGHAWHPDECVNTAPPARKPLTDEEIKKAMTEFENDIEPGHVFWRKIARAIERAHGIVND